MNDEVTIIIKTFQRPSCLNKLVESIRWFYPFIRIVIADDSKNESAIVSIPTILKKNIHYILLPFDSGASYGRNRALAEVTTPYVVTLDDDFVFTKDTKLDVWLNILKNSNIDIVGGNVENARYEACFNIENGVLRYLHTHRGKEYGLKLYDVVLQFWMGKTERIKQYAGWDDDFKTIDHSVFFLRAFNKLKIAYCSEVSVDHQPEKDPEYNEFRYGKTKYYYNLILKKYNFKKIVGYNSEILYDNI
jgi:(N-acetylneuraminyl)-galactosylglucosylceramide N-acetylgalactosaminyltransferase